MVSMVPPISWQEVDKRRRRSDLSFSSGSKLLLHVELKAFMIHLNLHRIQNSPEQASLQGQ